MFKKFLRINGEAYPVMDRGGFLKAAVNGLMGWTFIWAKDETELGRKIAFAQRGGGQ